MMTTSNQILKFGEVYSNDDINRIFAVAPQGGIRISNKNNCILLIRNPNGIYHDRWDEEGVLHYTGEGQIGNQTLKRGNFAIYNSRKDGRTIHLFEVVVEKQYKYLGTGILADEPWTETQPDVNKDDRTVYVFPIKLTDGDSSLSQSDFDTIQSNREKEVRKKGLEELESMLEGRTTRKPSVRQVKVIERDTVVSEYVKKLADGK